MGSTLKGKTLLTSAEEKRAFVSDVKMPYKPESVTAYPKRVGMDRTKSGIDQVFTFVCIGWV